MNRTTIPLISRGLLLIILYLSTVSISAQKTHRHRRPEIPSAVPYRYNIRVDCPEQTVLHFGASDAWSMQYIGLWPQKQQEQIADWLFSMEADATGQPKGIGLSLWRMNLGAGSAEQGDSSQINRDTRTECLLQPDGSWDMSRQAGQRKFLQLAKQRGVPYLLLFCNSAPVQFTQNGLATNTGRGGDINLKKDCYDDFARFLSTAVQKIEAIDGVKINYISPVNEPDGHWNWLGPKQEGSPATNREIARLAREVNKSFKSKKMDTQILLNESSDIRCLLGIYEAGWERGNTIHTLFGKDSTKTCIKGLSNIPNVVLGHAYWTNTPVEQMRQTRMALRDTLRNYGLDYWQSEVCIMNNDEEIGGGGGFDFSMKTALYVARMIHYDMVYGNACSWSWWRAAGGNYKDGLIRIYSHDGMHSGYAVDSKQMWTMGNYSRFIRPGAKRLDVEVTDTAGIVIPDGDTQPYGVMLSAYINKDGKRVVVALNYSERTHPLSLTIDGVESAWRLYRTSDRSHENLSPVGTVQGKAILPPRSATTFVEE